MLEAVPARVVGRVAEAEVGPWSMIAVPAAMRSGTIVGRGAVGQGEEDRVRGGQLGVDGQVGRREVRVDAADRVVVAAAADEPDELDVRVAGQEPDELGADIAGRADDPDPDPPRPTGRVAHPVRSGGAPRMQERPGSARRLSSHDYTRSLHSHATEPQRDRGRRDARGDIAWR